MKKEILSDKVQYFGWLFFILVILEGVLSGCNLYYRDVKSATVSADGKTAYCITYLESNTSGHRSLSTLPPLYLDIFDLSQNKMTGSYKVPSHPFRYAYLFTQGTDIFLVIPQEEAVRTQHPWPCNIYLCRPDQPPELISSNDFYLGTPFEKPNIWQNSAVLIGQDQSGGHALMYMQEGKITVLPLNAREEFAAGIQSISFSDNQNNNGHLYMSTVEVRLYNNQMCYISPFLTGSGVPLIEQAPNSISGKDDMVVRFAREYYGDNKLLIIRKQRDNSAELAAVPLINRSSLRGAETPVPSETLYHAICITRDNSTQWVLGYTGANPEQAAVTGYRYDIKSGTLARLPTLGNFDLKKVQSVISCTPDHLILRIGGSGGKMYTDALIIPLGEDAPIYASTIDFSDSRQQTVRRMNTFEVRLMGIILGSFVLVVVIVIIAGLVFRFR